MNLDPDTCYRAVSARDARFDGRFFVGVTSTGVYCRPVCRVKTPMKKNCRFFVSAAAAEAAGFRPCLRCRPELAPGNASVDANARLAQAAAGMIETEGLNGSGVEAIARRLGVSGRHLRRVFEGEFGVAPIDFLQTQRLLLAKRLLTDTRLRVTEVALASGFGSLRRFHALFRSRYRLNPRELRRTVGRAAQPDALAFELAYRPPYDWEGLCAFLAQRTIGGVEAIEEGRYRRTVRIDEGETRHVGWIEVRPAGRKPVLRVRVSASLAKAIPALLARVRHLMDLACHPDEVASALGPLAARHPGCRVPGAFDGYEVAVRAILGQQVSVASARTLATRFAERFGASVDTPFASLTTLFPAAGDVADVRAGAIARLGVIGARARSILALSKAASSGRVALRPGADVETTLAQLEALPGIGDWTAQYIAMRALAWPDAFPASDLGVLRALREKSPKRAAAAAERWRPWRAYAVMHLWRNGGGG
ncbi:MAG TPA: AlkA N-terminal domain-containing protein [Burkholderiales bacterium]|nr:AlkA N-terminal domain-containing protein [Burkholderiales bacterium]